MKIYFCATKPAFFEVKATNLQDRAGFALGLHGLKPGFAWFQTPNQPGTRPKAAGQPKAGFA
jgi:hypothetical protein